MTEVGYELWMLNDWRPGVDSCRTKNLVGGRGSTHYSNDEKRHDVICKAVYFLPRGKKPKLDDIHLLALFCPFIVLFV